MKDFFLQYHTKVMLFICVIGLLYGISIGINFVAIPLMFKNYHLSKKIIGMIMAAELAAPLFASPIIPKFVQKFGMLKVVIFALILRNITLLIIPIYHSKYFWFPSMFLFGCSGVVLFTCLQFWVNDICNDKNRELSFASMNTAFSIGITLGSLIINVVGRVGFTPFLVSAIFALAIFIPLLIVKHSVPSHMTKSYISFLAVLSSKPLAILGGILCDFVFFSLTSFIVLYGLECGLPEQRAVMLITVMIMSGIITELPVGYLCSRINKVALMLGAAVTILITALLLPLVIDSYLLSIPLFMFLCAALAGMYISSLSILGNTFKGNDLVAANSTFALMNCVGAISGVLFTGFAIDLFGKDGLSYSIIVACILFMILIITQNKKIRLT